MNKPRLVVAGAGSGSGKTTVALALMAALRRRGFSVQGFKSGPDYIDPGHHTAVTGRPSRNLDIWMMGLDVVREIFQRASAGADLSIIEGVMGLYDGKDPESDSGSTAELSRVLDAPVLLVIDAAGMARSAAAVVLGFQRLDPTLRLAGVIVNRVGGPGHYQLLKTAIESACGVEVVGYLQQQERLAIPERHLGLVPASESDDDEQALSDALASALESTVDLERIVQIGRSSPPWPACRAVVFTGTRRPPSVMIAVARDSAFHFYYPENLELLAWHGAEVRFFRPLAGELIPEDADGLYWGGGFPEVFAADLSRQTRLLEQVRDRIRDGLPTFAECGGLMFLARELVDREGCSHAMAGVIPAVVRMQGKLAAFGYREARALQTSCLLAAGDRVRGHEFHYSTVEYEEQTVPHAYEVSGSRGTGREGYVRRSLLAGYTHLHLASSPGAAARFVQSCQAHRENRRSHS